MQKPLLQQEGEWCSAAHHNATETVHMRMRRKLEKQSADLEHVEMLTVEKNRVHVNRVILNDHVKHVCSPQVLRYKSKAKRRAQHKLIDEQGASVSKVTGATCAASDA